MARVVGPGAKPQKIVRWDAFDDGSEWRLDQGVDFPGTPRAAGHAARQWAFHYGRRVTVKIREGYILLTIHPKVERVEDAEVEEVEDAEVEEDLEG